MANLVSVVLLISIVLIGIGSIGALGYATITEDREEIDTEQASNQLHSISSAIEFVTTSPADATQTQIDFGEFGSAASVDGDAGELSVRVISERVFDGYENPAVVAGDDSSQCFIPITGGDNPYDGDTDVPEGTQEDEANQPLFSCEQEYDSDSEVSVDLTDQGISVSDPYGGPNNFRNVGVNTESFGFSPTDAEYFHVVGWGVPDDGTSITFLGLEEVTHGDEVELRDRSGDSYNYYLVDYVVRTENGDANVGSMVVDTDGNEVSDPSVNQIVPGVPQYSGEEPDRQQLPYTEDLGSITYDVPFTETRLAYQGGAMFQQNTGSGDVQMTDSPNIQMRLASGDRADSFILPMNFIREGDNTALSSHARVERLSSLDRYPERYLTDGVDDPGREDEMLEIEIESEYAGAWANYFETEFDDEDFVDVSRTGENRVSVFIGVEEELYVEHRTSTVEVTG